VIGVQVPLRDGRVRVTGHPLQHVELHAAIGHPRQRRLAQAVPHQARKPEPLDELISVGGVPQRGGGDDTSARPSHQSVIERPAGNQRIPVQVTVLIARPCPLVMVVDRGGGRAI